MFYNNIEERWVFCFLWSQHVALGVFVSPIRSAQKNHFTEVFLLKQVYLFFNGLTM